MITLALPKGRLSKTLGPLLANAGLEIEPAYFADEDRRLVFATSQDHVQVVPVKPFDVATIVAVGGAQLGIVGSDVLEEFDFSELYVPLAFPFGACRLSVAAPKGFQPPKAGERVRVATKYPSLTRRYFERQGISPDIINLNGAMELAPLLGISDCIVDLVSTGATLKANKLVEFDTVLGSTARLIVGRQAYKTEGQPLMALIDAFRALSAQAQAQAA